METRPFVRAVERVSARAPWAVQPRKRLDIAFRDFARGAAACLRVREQDRAELEACLSAMWGAHTQGVVMPFLSVRTAFDAYLTALALPAGSEVIMSAITIPDMVRIVEHHGLLVVPVDVDAASLQPSVAALDAAVTDRTRLVVLAHVFGARMELNELLTAAHRHGLPVVEDCAEVFAGLQYAGHPASDVVLFSFGTIKHCTALGGCVAIVRDGAVAQAVHTVESAYPTQSNAAYAAKVLKYASLHGAVTPALFGALVAACRAARVDYDAAITRLSRGFPGPDLIAQIRRRPSAALLAMLLHRLSRFEPASLESKRRACERAIRLLTGEPGITVPGWRCEHHSFWLFPVAVEEPRELVAELCRARFDATQGTTQLRSIDRLTQLPRAELHPRQASELMQRIVYLPVDAELGRDRLLEMVDIVKRVAGSVRSKL